MIATVVDPGALLELVWVSLVAGVGITAVFSIGLLGATRSGEARRAGSGAGATAYGALAVIAGLVFAAGVVFGVGVLVGR